MTLSDLPAPDEATARRLAALLNPEASKPTDGATPRFPQGPNLRAARESAGLKAEQAALALGKSVYTIHEYERGRVVPPADALIDLSRIYGVSIDAMLGLGPG